MPPVRLRFAVILTLDEIVRATGAEVMVCGPGKGIESVSVDSRRLSPGALFVALRGPRFDGHDFLNEAVAGGARALLVDDRKRVTTPPGGGATVFAVKDCLIALGDLGAYLRRRNRPRVVAVTGSNGKTTTKEMLAEILAACYGAKRVLRNSGNENNLVGVPLTLLRLSREKLAVVEMGTNAPGEIARLTEIADPDIGVITNIGPAHLEGLGSIDGVAREKAAMIERMRPGTTAVLNADDARVKSLADGFAGEVVTFGDKGQVRAVSVREASVSGMRFGIAWRAESVEVMINYLGHHNVANALAAAAAALAAGVGSEAIREGLEKARPVAMRMEVLRLPSGAGLISDCYNANPASVSAALDALRVIKAGRRIAVLGEMAELGGESVKLHRQVGELTAKAGLWRLYLLGRYAEAVASGATAAGMEDDKIKLAASHAEIADSVRREASKGDWILIKGSRSQRMEQVVELLMAQEG